MIQQPLPLAYIHGEAVVEKPEDLFIPPNALEVILEQFEGPLDLLLYLIRKQKFDILDLPIAPITQQYMRYIEILKNAGTELVGDYLVMASTLAEIKSRLLLPKPEVENDDEDPRQALVRRLQLYEIYKDAAQKLDELPQLERDLLTARLSLQQEIDSPLPPVDVSLEDLHQAFKHLLTRAQAFEHHHVEKERLSTRERIGHIIERLQASGHDIWHKFSVCFEIKEGKAGVVVSFLALLSLLKDGLIKVKADEESGQIMLALTYADYAD